ncbi:MAG: hypothetical protein PHW72_00115 [Candidatus Pacebacteria bacterium]|nr:hypothetical protein [Candidatus Paceibacterota bacterium]
MIPIVTISSIIVLIFLSLLTVKIYFSYLKKRSATITYFLKAFISFCLALLIFAPNGILIKDLETISLIFNIYTFFVFLGANYLVMLTLQIMQKQLLKKILFPLILIYGFLVSAIPVLDLKPALVDVQGSFIFWEDARGDLINNLIGFGLAAIIVWVISFFIYNGLKTQDKYTKRRSLLISAGMTCFLLGSATDYILAASQNIFYVSIFTVFWYILTTAFLLFAVEYKKEENFKENV